MSNTIRTVTIMDINFLNVTKKDFLSTYLYPRLENEEKTFIVTANPEIVMKARENIEYKQCIQLADYVVPDGAGILMAAKYAKKPLQERIAGYDLMKSLLELADQRGLRCYFLGAKESVNEEVVKTVQKNFSNITIAGRQHGFFDLNDSKIAEEIKNSSADIIFVALGLPRQEQWIAKYKHEFTKGMFIGVGGSFDVLTGRVKRAPNIWIKLNLEWLYRLLKQPFRVKRIFKVFEFMIRVIFKIDK